MLRRIPAVKWAFTRLRPAPHDGSLDATPVAADVSPVIAEDIVAESIAAQDVAAPDATAQDATARDTTAQASAAKRTEVEDLAESDSTDTREISAILVHDDAEIAASTPSAQDDPAISVIAESPPAAPTDASDESSREAPSSTEPVAAAEEEAPVAAAEIETVAEDAPAPVISTDTDSVVGISAKVASLDAEPVDVVSEAIDAADLVISSDPFPAEAEPVVTAEASPSPVEIESAPLDVPALVVADSHSTDVTVDVEPTADEPCIASADAEVLAEAALEDHLDSASSPGEAVAVEPAAADVAPAVAAVVVQHGSMDAASVVTDIAPAPALVSPSPEVRGASKVRARPVEPADRTALIRQRWAESGIRMWNPRLHGTGEATLNIQGSVGLLPPAPGETMPRYDKLEFKLLGGQIICEGVIVEAPAQASHRSFTRLAEPGKPERAREPARERQAALA
ncbi:hypothetical protein UNPF46_26155 [Bradyrhizobium sp. UNPF46]|uniref:hypothetical protein n=1 Tax=Bradyrhizobium sp. UNPF46 TaxID=1141168 RepID=UPI0011541E12|nr:hypothetical protein [Bradyrhizobium sp. UNPF46]TQF35137.1 hypothetical protein UNPF46_26155 [Bradyrhizobium sp. UNPF46]